MNKTDVTVIDNLKIIKERIKIACHNHGRVEQDVKLLLATKTVPADKIRTVLNTGHQYIGENKVQEAKRKVEALKDFNAQWHMIGHLQTNKIKHVLKFADVIQSIDRDRCQFDNREIDIFIQVNTSFEQSKFGVAPEKAIEFIKRVSEHDRLNIKGLMTIGILSSKNDKVRDCFKRLKEIQEAAVELKLPNAEFKELSMGMSNDLELAIAEGSTMIRVGTAIFGARPYPDSYYWSEN